MLAFKEVAMSLKVEVAVTIALLAANAVGLALLGAVVHLAR
jgi:hypothetical protein